MKTYERCICLTTYLAVLMLVTVESIAFAETCKTDADCEEGYQCEKDLAEPACDGGCDTPSEPVEAETGECRIGRMECKTDDDCLEGLTCDIHQIRVCSGAIDGGDMECETTQQTTGECEYVSRSCESDADCREKYECVTMGVGELCKTIEYVGDGGPPADASCIMEERKYCFPKRANCAKDTDCEEGWVCYTFSESTHEPPISWGVSGDVKSCLPEVMAAEASEGGSSKSGGAVALGSAESDSVNNGESSKAEDSGGGCTIMPARTRTPHDGRYALAIVVFGSLLLYRRKRRIRRSGLAERLRAVPGRDSPVDFLKSR